MLFAIYIVFNSDHSKYYIVPHPNCIDTSICYFFKERKCSYLLKDYSIIIFKVTMVTSSLGCSRSFQSSFIRQTLTIADDLQIFYDIKCLYNCQQFTSLGYELFTCLLFYRLPIVSAAEVSTYIQCIYIYVSFFRTPMCLIGFQDPRNHYI